MTIFLDRADALELYCYLTFSHENHLIDTIDEKKLESSDYLSFKNMNFTSEQFLRNAFKKHKVPKFTEDINYAIFGKLKAKRFYNFASQVRFTKRITATTGELNYFYKFLNSFSGRYISQILINALRKNISAKEREKKEWHISSKKYNLENSFWWLFYWEKKSSKIGITRSLLHFANYGRVMIFDYNSKSLEQEIYSGTFEIYNQSYVQIKMKLLPSNTKNLSINLFIGDDEFISFALGQYNNIDGKIYSGTVIIKKIEDRMYNINDFLEKKTKESIAQFFPNDEETLEISIPIKKMLSKKEINYISVPNTVIPEDKLGIIEELL